MLASLTALEDNGKETSVIGMAVSLSSNQELEQLVAEASFKKASQLVDYKGLSAMKGKTARTNMGHPGWPWGAEVNPLLPYLQPLKHPWQQTYPHKHSLVPGLGVWTKC